MNNQYDDTVKSYTGGIDKILSPFLPHKAMWLVTGLILDTEYETFNKFPDPATCNDILKRMDVSLETRNSKRDDTKVLTISLRAQYVSNVFLNKEYVKTISDYHYSSDNLDHFTQPQCDEDEQLHLKVGTQDHKLLSGLLKLSRLTTEFRQSIGVRDIPCNMTIYSNGDKLVSIYPSKYDDEAFDREATRILRITNGLTNKVRIQFKNEEH